MEQSVWSECYNHGTSIRISWCWWLFKCVLYIKISIRVVIMVYSAIECSSHVGSNIIVNLLLLILDHKHNYKNWILVLHSQVKAYVSSLVKQYITRTP